MGPHEQSPLRGVSRIWTWVICGHLTSYESPLPVGIACRMPSPPEHRHVNPREAPFAIDSLSANSTPQKRKRFSDPKYHTGGDRKSCCAPQRTTRVEPFYQRAATSVTFNDLKI